ncbi:MAG TPA: hypothetical protein PLB25_00695 [Rhodoferax sp.]|nr:hypothetical protein [Rhodoferax sp.]
MHLQNAAAQHLNFMDPNSCRFDLGNGDLPDTPHPERLQHPFTRVRMPCLSN